MKKYYCDCCEEELTRKNRIGDDDDRLKGELSKKGMLSVSLRVEVVTGKGCTWNAGDFCKYCVLDALYKADDRPRCVDEPTYRAD